MKSWASSEPGLLNKCNLSLGGTGCFSTVSRLGLNVISFYWQVEIIRKDPFNNNRCFNANKTKMDEANLYNRTFKVGYSSSVSIYCGRYG